MTGAPNQDELASYVERGGEAVLRPPYQADDVDFYGFAIRASRPALDSMFHRYINEPSNFAYDYRAATDIVLVVFTLTPRLSSTDRFDRSIGWTTEREVSYWVLGVDPQQEELGFFVPYIFTDSPESVTTGREVFGFPKRLAAVGLPPDTKATREWLDATPSVTALDLATEFGYLFPNMNGTASGAAGVNPVSQEPTQAEPTEKHSTTEDTHEKSNDVCVAYPTYELERPGTSDGGLWSDKPLIRVHTKGDHNALVRSSAPVWTRGEAAIENVLTGVVGVPSPIFVGERTGEFAGGRAVALRGFSFSREQESALGRLAEGIAENYDKTTVAFNLRGLIEEGGVRLLFLKQFRDAYQRGRAAYREVLPAIMSFSGDRYTRGFAIHAGSKTTPTTKSPGDNETGLLVTTQESALFPIRRELGLEETEEVLFSFFLRFGFSIELAKGRRPNG